jgi:lipopolysaccharide transport system permease protein
MSSRVVRIEPASGWVSLRLRELCEYRELLYFLVQRDVTVRYKQTILGASWAVIQPVFTMLIFSVFLGRLAKMPSDGIPYPLFTFAALVPWGFFSNGLNQSANSLVGNSNLITKVHFPRLVIPVATILSGAPDFALAFITLLCLMGHYRVAPTAHVLMLIPFSVLALITALGAGLWLSALNVQFRDVRHAVPFLTQFWMFATPIVYPSSLLREPWRTVYGFNPMVGVVEGFRWALLGTHTVPLTVTAASTIASVVLLASGAYYFKRMENTFADIV